MKNHLLTLVPLRVGQIGINAAVFFEKGLFSIKVVPVMVVQFKNFGKILSLFLLRVSKKFEIEKECSRNLINKHLFVHKLSTHCQPDPKASK